MITDVPVTFVCKDRQPFFCSSPCSFWCTLLNVLPLYSWAFMPVDILQMTGSYSRALFLTWHAGRWAVHIQQKATVFGLACQDSAGENHVHGKKYLDTGLEYGYIDSAKLLGVAKLPDIQMTLNILTKVCYFVCFTKPAQQFPGSYNGIYLSCVYEVSLAMQHHNTSL